MKLKVLSHSPYSPDIIYSPNHNLFKSIKNSINEKKYTKKYDIIFLISKNLKMIKKIKDEF